jgi:hypothetical protein
MRRVSKPTSCPATPSQSRWLWTLSSSEIRVLMYWARGGIWRPAISSTQWVKAVECECEQIPQILSMR